MRLTTLTKSPHQRDNITHLIFVEAASMAFAAAATMAVMMPAAPSTRCSAMPLLPPRPRFGNASFATCINITALNSATIAESGRLSHLKTSRASSSEETSVDANEIFEDLKEKWDGLENKSTVLLYGGGAIVAVWVSSILVGAINSVPLLPKIMELVGLGYTGWFVYRYLLFKSSRKELATDIESLKKKIAGTE